MGKWLVGCQVALVLTVSAVAVGIWPAVSSAATFGQLGSSWGSAGTGASEFFKSGLFGVDPESGDVYTGGFTSGEAAYRIQRFSESGGYEAVAEIPKKDPATGKIVQLAGIAVDPDADRVYVLESCRVSLGSTLCSQAFGELFAAVRIHVFAATPVGGKLESAGSIAMPAGAGEVYAPTAISVDPASGDLVILGEDAQEGKGHKVVQRIGSAGTVGPRYTDSADLLKPPGQAAVSLTVGPSGVAYLLTGGNFVAGSKATRAWQLSADLGQLSAVPGFAAAAEDEEWRTPLDREVGTINFAAPSVAISPDGGTLYWKELFAGTDTLPEGVLVRAYSLSEKRTRTVYGGGVSSCRIQTSSAGIGVSGEGSGEHLLVFDYTPARVLRFGPGGSGCPSPAASFSIDGVEGDGTVLFPGETANFAAQLAEGGEGAREVVWDFGDGQKQVTECELEEGGEECLDPVGLSAEHVYSAAGEFTVTLEVRLIGAVFGNPAPVQHTLKVQNPSQPLSVIKAGTGTGTVTSAPAGIDCGVLCGSEFEQGTVVSLAPSADEGSEFAGWSGACSGTGACQVTLDGARTVTATFKLEEGTPPPSEFQLTVFKNGTGTGTVVSSPAGISCGAECQAEFPAGEVVSLAPSADEGSEFAGWSGACSGTGACQVTLSEVRSVAAQFEPKGVAPPPRFTLTVIKAGLGSGTVAGSRAGIYCGSKCEREYEEGDVVTLIPTPAEGSEFAGWSGACSGTGICKVTIAADDSVTAAFDPIPLPVVEPPVAAPAPPPAAETVKPKPRLSPRQKALRRCRSLAGKKRARCILRVKGRGRHRDPRHGRS